MSVARSVAEVLNEHVTLEVEGIDRMYLNVYVPQRSKGDHGKPRSFRAYDAPDHHLVESFPSV